MHSFLILIGKVLAVTSPKRLIVRRSRAFKCCKLLSEWSSSHFSPFIWMGSLKISEIVWRFITRGAHPEKLRNRTRKWWEILDRTRPRKKWNSWTKSDGSWNPWYQSRNPGSIVELWIGREIPGPVSESLDQVGPIVDRPTWISEKIHSCRRARGSLVRGD